MHYLIVIALFLSSCVSLAQEELELMDFTVATEMPEFALTDMRDGTKFHSSEHPDAAFVLEFYFTGCPACNQNARNVDALARRYAGNPNVIVLNVSVDCQEAAYRTWFNNHGRAVAALNACDAELVDTLGVSRFPTTYVFSPNRREAMRGVGVWSTSTVRRLQNYLDQVPK